MPYIWIWKYPRPRIIIFLLYVKFHFVCYSSCVWMCRNTIRSVGGDIYNSRVHNIFLQSFAFLWCMLLLLLFHFWFYLFGCSLFFLSFLKKVYCYSITVVCIFSPLSVFSWWVWLKVSQSCLCFQRTSHSFHCFFVSFFRLYFIYFSPHLYDSLSSTHFGFRL